MCLAIPGKITEIYQKDSLRMAKIDFGGISKEICLEYTPKAKLGDYALIHVGFAISLMDEEEAQETLKLLKEVAEFEDEISSSAPTAVPGDEDAALNIGIKNEIS